MSDFIVNESRFIIDMNDAVTEDFLEPGIMLPDGIVISDQLDKGSYYQIYSTEDDQCLILAIPEELAVRYVQDELLPERAFQSWISPQGRSICLLLSPCPLQLCQLSSVRVHGSAYFARSLAAAICHTRILHRDINLRDGIYCELYSVVLPSYSRSRVIADRAIFETALSERETENIAGPADMADPGLNYLTIRQEMTTAGIKYEPDAAWYFQPGDEIDDFIETKEPCLIAGPLCLTTDYQIYAAATDIMILIMERQYAENLMDAGLLQRIDLKTVNLGSGIVYAMSFSRRKALEPLNDRHFGLTKDNSLRLAQAIARTARIAPQARFSDALYSEALGLVLPRELHAAAPDNRARLMEQIICTGPFAMAPFLDEQIDDAIALAAR